MFYFKFSNRFFGASDLIACDAGHTMVRRNVTLCRNPLWFQHPGRKSNKKEQTGRACGPMTNTIGRLAFYYYLGGWFSRYIHIHTPTPIRQPSSFSLACGRQREPHRIFLSLYFKNIGLLLALELDL